MHWFFAVCAAFSVFISPVRAQVLPNAVDLLQRASSEVRGRTSVEVHELNLSDYRKFVLSDQPDTDRSRNRPQFLSPLDAADVLSDAATNPVVSLYQVGKYDPENRGIGFCFGRATFVHLELAYRGLDRDSVRKAVVVGPMKTPDGAGWGWHIATIAQSRDRQGREEWLALDPIFGLLTVPEWYGMLREKFSTDQKLRLYMTLPTRIGATPSHYDEIALRDPFYHQYFTDMLKWFEAESKAGAYERKRLRNW